ncbi:hypothetical protein F4805DRAFT_410010 [Annulohypoxylon moriforme]|nr:hypothetical protein F4805DRAFT_410010 [Annulohypoxylon moriforme]
MQIITYKTLEIIVMHMSMSANHDLNVYILLIRSRMPRAIPTYHLPTPQLPVLHQEASSKPLFFFLLFFFFISVLRDTTLRRTRCQCQDRPLHNWHQVLPTQLTIHTEESWRPSVLRLCFAEGRLDAGQRTLKHPYNWSSRSLPIWGLFAVKSTIQPSILIFSSFSLLPLLPSLKRWWFPNAREYR